MKSLNKKNYFNDAVNNVIANEKLYNSIIKLQNELVVFMNRQPKVVAIVAPRDRRHSSLMAKAVSEVYAFNNEKTLLMDLDMHEPTINKLYNLDSEKSLIDLVQEDPKEMALKINEYLDVVVSKTETYQAKFLVSNEFKDIMSKLKDGYDHIIVVLPPVLENQDVLLLNDSLDAVVLVTKKNETIIKDIKSSINFLKSNKLPFVGTIFIN
ncbi:MAG: hypothetical protein J1F32_02525 [Erysipelotrichales bacterium]|nr:hypothetical protein [Erysipelotrichales bacterium]